jgi:hypothetical protein
VKPANRRAAAASYRRYVIGYALLIFFRCYLMYNRPRPMRTSTLIAMTAFVFVLLLMMFLSYLRIEYGLLVIGILAVELTARDTGIKPLFLLEAALALLLAVLAFRKKEVFV